MSSSTEAKDREGEGRASMDNEEWRRAWEAWGRSASRGVGERTRAALAQTQALPRTGRECLLAAAAKAHVSLDTTPLEAGLSAILERRLAGAVDLDDAELEAVYAAQQEWATYWRLMTTPPAQARYCASVTRLCAAQLANDRAHLTWPLLFDRERNHLYHAYDSLHHLPPLHLPVLLGYPHVRTAVARKRKAVEEAAAAYDTTAAEHQLQQALLASLDLALQHTAHNAAQSIAAALRGAAARLTRSDLTALELPSVDTLLGELDISRGHNAELLDSYESLWFQQLEVRWHEENEPEHLQALVQDYVAEARTTLLASQTEARRYLLAGRAGLSHPDQPLDESEPTAEIRAQGRALQAWLTNVASLHAAQQRLRFAHRLRHEADRARSLLSLAHASWHTATLRHIEHHTADERAWLQSVERDRAACVRFASRRHEYNGVYDQATLWLSVMDAVLARAPQLAHLTFAEGWEALSQWVNEARQLAERTRPERTEGWVQHLYDTADEALHQASTGAAAESQRLQTLAHSLAETLVDAGEAHVQRCLTVLARSTHGHTPLPDLPPSMTVTADSHAAACALLQRSAASVHLSPHITARDKEEFHTDAELTVQPQPWPHYVHHMALWTRCFFLSQLPL